MLSLIQYWKRYWEAIRSSNAVSLERAVHVEGGQGGAMGSLGFCRSRLAVFTIVWVFALKLKTFYDLGYSGDLFVECSSCTKLA